MLKNYFYQSPEGSLEYKLCKRLQKNGIHKIPNKYINKKNGLLLNFKNIIEQRNKKILSMHCNKKYGNKLSPIEFKKIYKKIFQLNIPYQAAQFLDGVDGTQDINLGNGRIVNIYETSYYAQKNHHKSIFQYLEQKQMNKGKERFDVTILINGLPITQIELKAPGIDPLNSTKDSAYQQIIRYQEHGAYKGLYNTLQMFVIMNDVRVYYFAPQILANYSKDLVFTWRDKYDKGIESPFNNFIDDVLNPTTIYNLTSTFRPIITTNKNNNGKSYGTIALQHSYQYYCSQELLNYISKNKYAYVNNATGSGKTMTACQLAKILASNGYTVILVVDRSELDDNYYNTFNSYVMTNKKLRHKKIKNSHDFIIQMRKTYSKVLVVTMQTLNRVCKAGKYVDNNYRKSLLKIVRNYYRNNNHVIFIADEIQRSQMSKMKNNIQRVFKHALWYGFTGTPILPINAKGPKGAKATTKDFFKHECKTKYTILDALDDGITIPFSLSNNTTTKDKNALEKEILKIKKYQNKKHTMIKIKQLWKSKYGRAKLENKYAKPLIYNKSSNKLAHMKSVVQTIIHSLFNLTNPKSNYTHHILMHFKALLVTENNNDVLTYYNLLKNYQKEYHFKVTGLCSLVDENNSKENKAYLSGTSFKPEYQNMIKDYKNKFSDSSRINGFKSYSKDVRQRLQQKGADDKDSNKRLDLCIVDDQLLTGFNAKKLNTLYIDKTVNSYQLIVQMFSRINRKYPHKEEGHILIFRTPDYLQVRAEKAYTIYGNGKTVDYALRNMTYPKTRRLAKKSFNNLENKYNASSYIVETKPEKDFVKKYAQAKHDINLWANSLYQQPQDNKDIPIDIKTIQRYKNRLTEYHTNYTNCVGRLQENHHSIPTIVADDIKQTHVAYKLNDWKVNNTTIRQFIKKAKQFMNNGQEFKHALMKSINVINVPNRKYYQEAIKRLSTKKLKYAKQKAFSQNKINKNDAYLLEISCENRHAICTQYAQHCLTSSASSKQVMSDFNQKYSSTANKSSILPSLNLERNKSKSCSRDLFLRGYQNSFRQYCEGKDIENTWDSKIY